MKNKKLLFIWLIFLCLTGCETPAIGGGKISITKTPTLTRTCWNTTDNRKVFILAMGANTNGLKKSNQDAERFATTMSQLFKLKKNVCVLKNAKRQEFELALKTLTQKVDSDDLVIIYYSGHGTKINDNNHDEKDKYDEAFVPYYSTREPKIEDLLRDDSFSELINAIPTENIITIIDACFSAGLTKGGLDGRSKSVFFDFLNWDDEEQENTGESSLENIKGVLLSAAGEGQKAKEFDKIGGRFTYFFIDALEQAIKKKRTKVDLATVFEKTRKMVRNHALRWTIFGFFGEVQVPEMRGQKEILRMINDYIP